MTGSSDNAAEQPRRRRRASRRAAGPPVSVSTPAVAELPDDADQVAAADPTAGAEDTTMDLGTVAGDGGPTSAELPADVGDAPADAASAVTSTVDDAGHAHGSPAGAPEHQPNSPMHSHAAAQGHSPGQGHNASTLGRDRSGDRAPSGGGATGEVPRRSGRPTREEASERSLRSLVTTRSTQVSPTAALRAREVGLPSAADLEAAEAELIIVRRHYVPPTTLAAGRRQDWPNRRGSGGQGSRPAGG
jgi:hypothetical protein